MAPRVIKTNLIGRTHDLRTHNLSLSLIGVFQSAGYANLDLGFVASNGIFYGGKPVFYDVTNLNPSRLAGEFEIYIHDCRLLNLTDNCRKHFKPTAPSLARQNLAQGI